MMPWFRSKKRSLEAEHRPDQISKRLQAGKKHNYIGDAVLGAMDGCVTTFAIVAGAMGGKLSTGIAFLLGVSNLLADGFSMAVGNFQKSKSEQEFIDKVRRTEERHIDQIPHGEKEEVRQIFARKGFQDPVLGNVVEGITKNRKLWVDTMLTEEYGLPLESANPVKAGLVTFVAFVLVGAVPLIPFLMRAVLHAQEMYKISILFTALAFFAVGSLKGKIVKKRIFASGFETLIVGGFAALLAFMAGHFLQGWIKEF